MDNARIGKLIRSLRAEKSMTQLQLAALLNISDKAVSKWERGHGSPDVSLLPQLSEILGVNIDKLLAGSLQPGEVDRGNLRNIRFAVCPDCGGMVTSTGNAEPSCCGRRLLWLEPRTADEAHRLQVEAVELDYYITLRHEMAREHFIGFIAYVTPDKLLLTRLYPEQSAEARFPRMYGGRLYHYCTRHGLWETPR